MSHHHRFAGSTAKVRRAKKHFEELEAKISPRSVDKAYTVLTQENGDTGEYVLELIVHPWHESEWSVIAGEIVHNLHSALDHAVCSLVRITRPTDDCSKTCFPIYKTPLAPGEERSELIGVPDAAHAIIEARQPHAVVGMPPTLHPFWQLRVLSNRDKHRELAFLSGLTLAEYDARVDGKREVGISAWTLNALDMSVYTFPDGTRRVRYVVPPPEVGVKTKPPAVYITFQEPADMRDRDVLLVLWSMIAETDRTLWDLQQAFP